MSEPLLDAADLIAHAQEAAGGLTDMGGDEWREGVERLVDSLATEAKLNEIGHTVATGDIVGHITNRLQVVQWRKDHPEVAEQPVVPPIVIVGQGRTGTTILFDLLACDPNVRVPLTWEVDLPVPPPQTATFDTDERIAQSQANYDMVDLVMPDFKQMHPMGALLAQECVRITCGDFRSMIYPTQFRVPSYADWLLHEADMSSAYRYHHQFLQHLHSGHPGDPWVLKSPGHIWSLDALLGEYPDALLVQTHRDPLRIIASLSSLIYTLRGMSSDDTSIPEAAEEFAGYLVEGLNGSVDARTSGLVPEDQVVDMTFKDFMADPFVTIGKVYDALGMELTDEALGNMQRFLDEHPADAHGGHRYSWENTGLDVGEWREKARQYTDHFDVPLEVS
jgi:hypothetical protein